MVVIGFVKFLALSKISGKKENKRLLMIVLVNLAVCQVCQCFLLLVIKNNADFRKPTFQTWKARPVFLSLCCLLRLAISRFSF